MVSATRKVDTFSFFGSARDARSPEPTNDTQSSPKLFPAVIPQAVEPVSTVLPADVQQSAAMVKRLPYNLHRKISLAKTPGGKTYGVLKNGNTRYALLVGSKKLNAIIAELARCDGVELKKADLADVNSTIEAYAEQYGEVVDVWLRVAPIEGGVEIDLGDDTHTRLCITAGKVEIGPSASDTVFFRTANTLPMTMPAEIGNRELLRKYLNVHPTEMLLLMAWITYILAHPKIPASKYPILVLQGSEGSGKTSLCSLLIRLIDPSILGVQVFPQNAKDLAIAGQNAHLLCFDNLRGFRATMADMLCIAATGGTITTRQLYTDADQQAIRLHVPLVLNGIHNFIGTPDLSQRCLPIYLIAMDKAKRKSEGELMRELEADLPAIMRGLFDLIAAVFSHLPNVEITNPERMIDFVAWLGAMERADGIPPGIYQGLYSETLQQGQLDTLMDNPLAAAIIEFMDKNKGAVWSDSPSEFLRELDSRVDRGTKLSNDWPQNPIALSKRIGGLQAGLLSQGIRIELSRGKKRTVTLSKAEA